MVSLILAACWIAAGWAICPRMLGRLSQATSEACRPWKESVRVAASEVFSSPALSAWWMRGECAPVLLSILVEDHRGPVIRGPRTR